MRLALALCAFLGTACVTVNVTRFADEREPEEDVLLPLVPGEADLTQCLEVLGAPVVVEELDDGAVLGWGWRRFQNMSVNVSVPISSDASASVQYGRGGDGIEGIVLFFDSDWGLVEVKRGHLQEILRSSRSRPKVIE